MRSDPAPPPTLRPAPFLLRLFAGAVDLVFWGVLMLIVIVASAMGQVDLGQLQSLPPDQQVAQVQVMRAEIEADPRFRQGVLVAIVVVSALYWVILPVISPFGTIGRAVLALRLRTESGAVPNIRARFLRTLPNLAPPVFLALSGGGGGFFGLLFMLAVLVQAANLLGSAFHPRSAGLGDMLADTNLFQMPAPPPTFSPPPP